MAAARNDLAGMRTLLDNGADVNLRAGGNYDGCEYGTALHVAARAGNHDMLQLLLERGADCNVMNRHYYTPLHYATDSKWHIVAGGCRRLCRWRRGG